MPDEPHQTLLRLAEVHADDPVSPEQFLAAAVAADLVRNAGRNVSYAVQQARAAVCALQEDFVWWMVHEAASRTAEAAAYEKCGSAISGAMITAAYNSLCPLLADVLGNPEGQLPQVAGEVLRWNDGTVSKIAQAIYDERRFCEMPILADALEEAGCNNEAILRHCREPGEHVRGCWVIDLLLGKE